MIVTVKFGDEQQHIFNAACRNDVLLNHIKTRCRCPKEDVVELSDERGVVKNLRLSPKDYATTYLKSREDLVLLRVKKNISTGGSGMAEERNEKTMFTPLLQSLMNNNEFLDALNPTTKEDDGQPDMLNKSRRPSSLTDPDEKIVIGKIKTKTNNLSNLIRKPASRRGHRPPLRKSANTS